MNYIKDFPPPFSIKLAAFKRFVKGELLIHTGELNTKRLEEKLLDIEAVCIQIT
jgi:hypothetical protein